MSSRAVRSVRPGSVGNFSLDMPQFLCECAESVGCVLQLSLFVCARYVGALVCGRDNVDVGA